MLEKNYFLLIVLYEYKMDEEFKKYRIINKIFQDNFIRRDFFFIDSTKNFIRKLYLLLYVIFQIKINFLYHPGILNINTFIDKLLFMKLNNIKKIEIYKNNNILINFFSIAFYSDYLLIKTSCLSNIIKVKLVNFFWIFSSIIILKIIACFFFLKHLVFNYNNSYGHSQSKDRQKEKRLLYRFYLIEISLKNIKLLKLLLLM